MKYLRLFWLAWLAAVLRYRYARAMAALDAKNYCLSLLTAARFRRANEKFIAALDEWPN